MGVKFPGKNLYGPQCNSFNSYSYPFLIVFQMLRYDVRLDSVGEASDVVKLAIYLEQW